MNNKKPYLYATISTLLLFLGYFCIFKIFPFGENTILRIDLNTQYINFYNYLNSAKNIFFSWQAGLGSGFFITFSYYLSSPFNLLIFLFKPENMYIYAQLAIVLKCILASCTFVFFLRNSYNYKKNDVIIFSMMYSFSAYVICYSFNIMWLDALYMLPICLCLIDKEKLWKFSLALGFTLLFNFYTGFMVAFFSGLYFLYKKSFSIKNIFTILLPILLSFGMSMILFLPTILKLGNGMLFKFDLLNIKPESIPALTNIFFNNFLYYSNKYVPLVYTGMLTPILFPLYFMNKNIFKKEKILTISFLIFLLLPIISPFFNLLWHGFDTPNMFEFRYAFVITIILILIAFRTYVNREYIEKKHLFISFLIFASVIFLEVVCFSCQAILNRNPYTAVAICMVITTFIYFLLYLKPNKITNALLVLIIFIDLLVGAYNGQKSSFYSFLRIENYNKYDEIINTFMEEYLENPEIERIAFVNDEENERTYNLALTYGYSGQSFFSSGSNINHVEGMYKLRI